MARLYCLTKDRCARGWVRLVAWSKDRRVRGWVRQVTLLLEITKIRAPGGVPAKGTLMLKSIINLKGIINAIRALKRLRLPFHEWEHPLYRHWGMVLVIIPWIPVFHLYLLLGIWWRCKICLIVSLSWVFEIWTM